MGLEATGEAGVGRTTTTDERMGSIDVDSVREFVEELWRVAKRAFELRRKKYRF